MAWSGQARTGTARCRPRLEIEIEIQIVISTFPNIQLALCEQRVDRLVECDQGDPSGVVPEREKRLSLGVVRVEVVVDAGGDAPENGTRVLPTFSGKKIKLDSSYLNPKALYSS